MHMIDVNLLIAMNVKRLRQRKGWTQETLAKKTGQRATDISKIEKGKKGVGKTLLERLCIALESKPFEFYWEDSILSNWCSTQDMAAHRICQIIGRLDEEHRQRLLKEAEDYLLLTKRKRSR